MRSTRTAVLIAILVLGIVPTASASGRRGDGPVLDRERIVRAVKSFLRIIGVVGNADQVIGPRP